ncbi:MAG: hypothetical protein RSD95_00630 [Clostridia bacterium]
MGDERIIRFIDSQYNELFYLRDGENVRITREDGEILIRACKFVDECHTQVGNYTFHICEFAENMERAGNRYAPEQPPELPDMCYAILPSTGELIVVHKGQKGYEKCAFSDANPNSNRRFATEQNRRRYITPQQEAAMLGGSMFGWKTPAARPSSYDLRGNPIVPAKKKTAIVRTPDR